MHPCLRISEILSEIVKYIVDGRLSGVEHGDEARLVDLANAARTCKAFYEPVMRVLWIRLYSLDPLMQFLSWSEFDKERQLRVSSAFVLPVF